MDQIKSSLTMMVKGEGYSSRGGSGHPTAPYGMAWWERKVPQPSYGMAAAGVIKGAHKFDGGGSHLCTCLQHQMLALPMRQGLCMCSCPSIAPDTQLPRAGSVLKNLCQC